MHVLNAMRCCSNNPHQSSAPVGSSEFEVVGSLEFEVVGSLEFEVVGSSEYDVVGSPDGKALKSSVASVVGSSDWPSDGLVLGAPAWGTRRTTA